MGVKTKPSALNRLLGSGLAGAVAAVLLAVGVVAWSVWVLSGPPPRCQMFGAAACCAASGLAAAPGDPALPLPTPPALAPHQGMLPADVKPSAQEALQIEAREALGAAMAGPHADCVVAKAAAWGDPAVAPQDQADYTAEQVRQAVAQCAAGNNPGAR